MHPLPHHPTQKWRTVSLVPQLHSAQRWMVVSKVWVPRTQKVYCKEEVPRRWALAPGPASSLLCGPGHVPPIFRPPFGLL